MPRCRQIILVLWLASALPTAGQDLSTADLQRTFLEGIEAYHAADFQQAASLLSRVVADDPIFWDKGQGSAAYWLGRTYMEEGQASRVWMIWEQGLREMEAANAFDVRMADAYLQLLVERGHTADKEQAEQVYQRLLRSIDEGGSAEERMLLMRHGVQAALLLPTALRVEVVEGDLHDGAETLQFKEGAGDLLLAWWRSRDPLPATRTNERLQEHLERVAFAEQQFAYADRATGFDDRGDIYIKYGVPSREKSLTFDDPQLIDRVYRPGVTVSPSDFPDNEFWLYRHVNRDAYYLFVEKDGYFRQGETFDLLPGTLRYGVGESIRTKQKAQMLLFVMRYIYWQLAMEHQDFAMRYTDVDLFANQIEEFEIDSRQAEIQALSEGEALPNRDDRINDLDNVQLFQMNPREFVQSMILQGRTADEQAAWKREQVVPAQYTDVFRNMERLPVSLRTARFLEGDGTTQTEIYWSPDPGSLVDRVGTAERDYLINLTAIQKTEDYRERAISNKQYLVTDIPAVIDAAIPAQTMVVQGDTGRYHLALQWDQYQAQVSEAAGVQVGPRLQVGTYQVDSLMALTADARVLEMSDVKPLLFEEEAGMLLDDVEAVAQTAAYPFAILPAEAMLALYFEVYHLTFGVGDETQFEVEYEVRGARKRGGRRLFGRRNQATSTSTLYTGQNRTAQEYILLDLSEWEGDGAMEVVVRVTDQHTGQQVERILGFEMNP